MPWCPKCKTEYRAGFTKCADCGSELVEDKPLEEESIPKWLEGVPEEYARQAMEDQAMAEQVAHAQYVAMQDVMKQKSNESGEEIPETPKPRRAANKVAYRDSADKANDNKSSGWMLLILGVLGLVVLVLSYFGILPFSISTSYFFYGVMAVMFVFFIIAGISSMRNAKTYTAQAESENSIRNNLKEWAKENLTAEEIIGIVQDKDDPVEIQYFKRFSYLKFILNKNFVNLDQDFLDNFIDEYLYDSIFGEND